MLVSYLAFGALAFCAVMLALMLYAQIPNRPWWKR